MEGGESTEIAPRAHWRDRMDFGNGLGSATVESGVEWTASMTKLVAGASFGSAAAHLRSSIGLGVP